MFNKCQIFFQYNLMSEKIAIIGAGILGLSLAYKIRLIKPNSKEDVESLKDNLTKQFQVNDQKFCMFPNINDDNYLISNNSFLGTENVEYFKIPFHVIEEIMF